MLTRLGIYLLWPLHFLPFRFLVFLGNALGSLLFLLAAERREVANINLGLCFSDMCEIQRDRLVREHFKMFGRGLIERVILWWSSAARINSLIAVEGVEHFNAVKGKPAILLMPHFVGMDVSGQWIAQHTNTVSYSRKWCMGRFSMMG